MSLSSIAWTVSWALGATVVATVVATKASAASAQLSPSPDKVVVVGVRRPVSSGRATSRVDRRDLEERLPRSAPDALRHEPGVYVQQSAHGQGSPYIRGRTGQQTVILFDGIRLNTSTWRQGPNQYFFTVDSAVIRAIEVTRGGASTLFGSDAVAGVIEAIPITPALDVSAPAALWQRIHPKIQLRGATPDRDRGGRLQMDAQLSPRLQILAGAGLRAVGLLRSGGPVRSPRDGSIPQVPVFAPDGVTQLGTGFHELTADARVHLQLTSTPERMHRLVGAAYVYRQYDSPRTDQCPAPFAPRDECLSYDEQFRSLAFLAHEYAGQDGRLRASRLALSFQRQHERRTLRRPSSFVRNGGRDDVNTFGLTWQARTAPWALGESVVTSFRTGADAYFDQVQSRAWTEFTDVSTVIDLSRGQYSDNSRYLHGGVFAQSETLLGPRVVFRLGGRMAGAAAQAPADAVSGTHAIDARWGAFVGNTGLEWRVASKLTVFATYDRSFRAPNLDDLTSRQQTGPGFQFENTTLRPETADTIELGTRVGALPFELDVWLFRSTVHDAISRSLRGIADCPIATPACATSWSRFQLVNAPGDSIIDGVEISGRFAPHPTLLARFAAAYAYGRGPNPQAPPADPQVPYTARVPLSRVPPLNGSVEARWAPAGGGGEGASLSSSSRSWRQSWRPYLGAAFRWALTQTRLAPTDLSDARIPFGGTPGFAVADLRAGVRVSDRYLVGVLLENLFDAPYRYHGSSVNGPGRGITLNLEGTL